MAMNREQKRMLQRAGEVNAEGEPIRRRQPRQAPQPKAKAERTSPRQFLHEVNAELRKVAWPTRSETINYSIIVLVALVVLTSFIFVVDYAFSQLVLKLFNA
ncbi:MAG TPA: preprotein translocase subunit SecE [Acidimicrobiales bacterium]|nr:preprotein translocase subunit SecE [Acidimicrobiales bacterium]